MYASHLEVSVVLEVQGNRSHLQKDFVVGKIRSRRHVRYPLRKVRTRFNVSITSEVCTVENVTYEIGQRAEAAVLNQTPLAVSAHERSVSLVQKIALERKEGGIAVLRFLLARSTADQSNVHMLVPSLVARSLSFLQ